MNPKYCDCAIYVYNSWYKDKCFNCRRPQKPPMNPDTDKGYLKGLPEMIVINSGDTWGWECSGCGCQHRENGEPAAGDMLVCEQCRERYESL